MNSKSILNLAKLYTRGVFNYSRLNNLMLMNLTSYRTLSFEHGAALYDIEDMVEKYKTFYPTFKQDILQLMPAKQSAQLFEEFMDYNLRSGRQLRALVVMKTFKTLATDELKKKITEEDIFTMAYLIEMVQLNTILNDDVCDQSPFRRGKNSWYVIRPFGITSDLLANYTLVFLLLKQKYGNTFYFDYVTHIFHKEHLRVLSGTMLDFLSEKGVENGNYEDYYYLTAIQKTDYTYKIPMNIGLYMAGYTDIPYTDILENIFREWGYLYQIMNDYMDIFGSQKDNGKVGDDDIKRGSITWFWLRARRDANNEQRKILETRYGCKDEESAIAIRKLYEDLNMYDKYTEEENKVMQQIKNMINTIPDPKVVDYFHYIFDKTGAYKYDSFILDNSKK